MELRKVHYTGNKKQGTEKQRDIISQTFFYQALSNQHTVLPLPDGASAQYLYQLIYSVQQMNAEPGACLGMMKCQAVKRAEPKALCASPASAVLS